MDIKELEKRIEKVEKIGILFEFLLGVVEGINQGILSAKENIESDKIMKDTLRKIRNKYNKITTE